MGDSNEPLKTTIGVEFECVLVQNTFPKVLKDQDRDHQYGIRVVRAALSEPLRARCAICAKNHSFVVPVYQANEIAGRFEEWHVGEDDSIYLSKEECMKVIGHEQYLQVHRIEFKTRILSTTKNLKTQAGETSPNHIHEITYEEEIRAVLAHLNKEFCVFDKEKKQDWLYVNDSCGLHFHVGNGARGFPLQTVKQVMMTALACERQIDILHAAQRIGGNALNSEEFDKSRAVLSGRPSRIDNAPYNHAVSEHFIAAGYLRRQREANNYANPTVTNDMDCSADEWSYPQTELLDPEMREAALATHRAAWLTLIGRAPILEEALGNGFNDHCNDLNMANLYDTATKQTIEFRQHSATLDAKTTLAWVDFVVKLVKHAHATDAANYAKLTAEDGEFFQPGFSVSRLLTLLECEPSTTEYHAMRSDPGFMSRELNKYAEQSRSVVAEGCHVMKDLVLAQREHMCADNAPWKVAKRIHEKLVLGCYGQFSAEALDVILEGTVDAELCKRLTIGKWPNPGPECSVRATTIPPGCIEDYVGLPSLLMGSW